MQANQQPHPSDYDPTNTTLFIGGLSAGVSEDDLRTLFGRFGEIVYTKIPPGKGCGFVQFVHRAPAEAAMATMQACPHFCGTSGPAEPAPIVIKLVVS